MSNIKEGVDIYYVGDLAQIKKVYSIKIGGPANGLALRSDES